MEIFRLATVGTKHAQTFGKFRIVSGTHTTVTERAEIFARKKRKTADVASAARAPAIVVLGANCLCGVFDYPQIVVTGKFHQRFHVGHLTKQMNRHDDFDSTTGIAIEP